MVSKDIAAWFEIRVALLFMSSRPHTGQGHRYFMWLT